MEKFSKKVNESVSREKIHIDKDELVKYIYRFTIESDKPNGDYELVENEITSSDEEDGGAEHRVVIKRKSDNKYFQFSYCDWDINHNFESDFPEDLVEVFPKTITTIIFV